MNGGADDFSEGHDDMARATLSTATNFKMMTEMKMLEEGPADTVRRVKAKPTVLGADTVRRSVAENISDFHFRSFVNASPNLLLTGPPEGSRRNFTTSPPLNVSAMGAAHLFP